METNEHKKIIYKVSLVCIILNVVLTLIKLFAGIFGNSNAMISDAIHSASDVLSTFVVILGVQIASKKADRKHPYGYEKFECIASIILTLILFATAVIIAFYAFKLIIMFINGTAIIPGQEALWAGIISIWVKEWMYRYSKKNAKLINSTALEADAWHHRSDAFSSIAAVIGVLGARLGFPILDPIISLLISCVILKVAYKITKESLDQIMDVAVSIEDEEKIIEVINNFEGIEHLDLLKTRRFGNRIYVDIEVAIDKKMSFENAHNLVHALHDKIENSDKRIKHCMIHANPI